MDAEDQSSGLGQHLTLRNGIALIVGGIVGSGIFLTPNSVFELSGSVGASIIVWVLAGLISLCGALCYCELGTSIPETGGEHVYFKRAFGPLAAFIFIWSLFLVISPVSTALTTLTFARYAIKPFYKEYESIPEIAEVRVAIVAIMLLAAINCFSSRVATKVGDTTTVIKLGAIAVLVLCGAFWMYLGHHKNFRAPFERTTLSWKSASLAFFEALYPYTGWNYLNYVAGEMQNPARDLPRAILLGMGIVMACYLLCNLAYFAILDHLTFINSKAIAVDSLSKVIGEWGLYLGPFFVASSTLGAANSSLYTAARVGYVAAREGHLPPVLGLVHARCGTPFFSVLFQAMLSVLFCLVNVNSLVLVFGFTTWTFFGCSFVAMLQLRRSEPDLPRPYKVPAAIGVFMVITSVLLVLGSFAQFPVQCTGGLVFLSLGVAVYYVLVEKLLRFTPLEKLSDFSLMMAHSVFAVEQDVS